MTEHCCEQMNFHIHEKEKIIYHSAKLREYGIRVSKHIIQCISFCPWCGTTLPENLSETWFKELAALGIEDHWDEEDKIPEEFKSDEWWKKRGL